jgi:chemotaxis protein CheD
LVLSALTDNNSLITDEAFNAGAVDFLKKPDSGSQGLNTLLVQLWTKIKIAATMDVSHLKKAKRDFKIPDSVLDRTKRVNKIILGMGMMDVSRDQNIEIKIFALGSCVGLAMFCPEIGAVGLAHVALPNSKTDHEKSLNLPGYFADTAVPALLNKMNEVGCPTNKIFAKIAGGAKTNVEIGDFFGIGQKNSIAVKANLIKSGIKLRAEEVGGAFSRTASLKSDNINLKLYHPEKGTWEI